MSEQDSFEEEVLKYNYVETLRKDHVNHLGGNERPLSPTGNLDVIDIVGKLAEFFLANAENVGDYDRKFCENIKDELRWTSNRFFIYEHALIGLKVCSKNNIELAQLLDGRYEVLYHLFGIDRSELSNEEIIETLKQSNDPRLTGGLYFDMHHHNACIHYPSLIKEFLDAVDKWQDDREKLDPTKQIEEPEMLDIRIEEQDDSNRDKNPRTRRFLRREWVQWHQQIHGNKGRGMPWESSIKAGVDILLNQLFPEGKPVDVKVNVDTWERSGPGFEIEIRRVVTNAEYF